MGQHQEDVRLGDLNKGVGEFDSSNLTFIDSHHKLPGYSKP